MEIYLCGTTLRDTENAPKLLSQRITFLFGTSDYFSVKLKWSYSWFNPGFIFCLAVKLFFISFYYFNCLPIFSHCFLHLRSNQTSFYCCMVSFQSFHCLGIPFLFNFKIAFLYFFHQILCQSRNYNLTFGPSRGTCLMEVSVILLYIISCILSVNSSLQTKFPKFNLILSHSTLSLIKFSLSKKFH